VGGGQGIGLCVEADDTRLCRARKEGVEVLQRLRGEESFDSVDDLKRQMAADVEATRELAGA
jgi:FAD synthase